MDQGFKVAQREKALGFGSGSKVDKMVTTVLTCLLSLKEPSRVTLRFLPECQMLEVMEPRSWREMDGEGLPTTTISVLLSLRYKKFANIHFLMSARQWRSGCSAAGHLCLSGKYN